MVTVNINVEERRIILQYLKEYIGLHESELEMNEVKRIKDVLKKIEDLSP